MKDGTGLNKISEVIIKGCKNIGATPHLTDINGFDLFWVENGQGKCILCLHGFSSCFYTWRHLITGLSDSFKIIAPDMPGFGCSGDDPANSYSLNFYCDVVERFIEEKALDRVILCGHSYGGLVCQKFVARRPSLVEALILIAPLMPGTHQLKLSKIENLMLYSYFDLSAVDPEVFDIFRAAKVRTPAVLTGLFRFPNILIKKSDTPPCLIVCGDEDRILPSVEISSLKEFYPNASIELLSEVGHCPQEESPDRLLKIFHYFTDNN